VALRRAAFLFLQQLRVTSKDTRRYPKIDFHPKIGLPNLDWFSRHVAY
jgi:hypothetical protein